MGGWSNTGLDELVIPSGATSGIRTVYGGTTPAELTAYGLSTVSRRIYTADADTYWFEGFQTAGSNQRIIRGWVINGVVTVTETEIYSTGLGNIQLTTGYFGWRTQRFRSTRTATPKRPTCTPAPGTTKS
jgi:hypothetical protein